MKNPNDGLNRSSVLKLIREFALLPLTLLFLTTFGHEGLSKLALLGSGPPAWFLESFGKSGLNVFPGALSAQFFMIAFLETGVALLFLISFIRLEFLANRKKPILEVALFASQLVFVMLGFGLRMTQDFHGAAEIFIYFGVSFYAAVLIKDAHPTASNGCP